MHVLYGCFFWYADFHKHRFNNLCMAGIDLGAASGITPLRRPIGFYSFQFQRHRTVNRVLFYVKVLALTNIETSTYAK